MAVLTGLRYTENKKLWVKLGLTMCNSNKRGQVLPRKGKWVKIPLLPENVGKRILNYLGTLEMVTTNRYILMMVYFEKFVWSVKTWGTCEKWSSICKTIKLQSLENLKSKKKLFPAKVKVVMIRASPIILDMGGRG